MGEIPGGRAMITGKFSVQEAFNLANHTNPARVSQFYAARGTLLGSYNHAIETLNARQVQFMIQFEY